MSIVRKKAWEIVKRSKEHFTGVAIDGKLTRKNFRKFGPSGAFVVHDPGEARYIEQAFGTRGGDGSVVVCEVDNAQGLTPRKSWLVPHLPWKKE